MGDIADSHINNFTAARWGVPISPTKAYPTTTKSAIAGNRFSVVKTLVGRTNRIPGTKLVVCDQDEETYWVWASSKVTGIRKEACEVLYADLDLNEALALLKRRPYNTPT